MTLLPRYEPPSGAPPVRRVAMLSVHASPLDQPGAGDGGGLNVWLREVTARLAARGIEVDVFTRRSDPSPPDEVELVPGVQVHNITAGPPRPVDKRAVTNHLCGFLLALQRHPAFGHHDLVHAHYWLSGWVGRRVAGRFDVPLVQTFHTLGVLKNATLAPGDTPEPQLRLVAEERIVRDADRILVLTCGEARLLHRTYRLSGARLTVVPAGVDVARFSPRPGAVNPSRRRSGPPRLLFAGRLQPLKGPDVAIRILAEVRRRLPDARLRIVGGTSGDDRTGPDALRALAAELGVADGLDLEPALDQAALADRYREADVVLVPSRSETFGLVALEAQASGVPVVAADVPGLEAVVGNGGQLVRGHDPADHAAAALAYLTDPDLAARTAEAGLRTARAASWDRTADRLLTAYGDVVDGHAAAAVAV